MHLFLLLLLLGVANWFATTLVVESELLRPVRDWIEHRAEERGGAWAHLTYLVGCHMCTGTWIGLAMALFVPPVVAVPVVGWLLTALAIRGYGHLVLLGSNLGQAVADRNQVAMLQIRAEVLQSISSPAESGR